ncbi:conserved hypothetical protein [uncultured Desulfobacterium sp.]|uniref:Uncharacterized protein n=1 Tax=uncultured Desulfobacterium sp. TaxID=201089 RepID=A0A445N0V3_9BACT|nr:conserved hypothetical protein [uncultured Desulfobacterium sp.]
MNSFNKQAALTPPKNASELLDIYFLDIRSALLESAAALDRIERAAGGKDILDDPRIQDLKRACNIIMDGKNNRSEQILLLLSHPLE